MASHPDRDHDSKDSPSSKPENPFIRFRQFADEQISSLLRSVIGLPSTFERGQNARWADFDDDLRRRDEFQARQQQLRESEARRVFQRASEEHGEIPVQKWPRHPDNEDTTPPMDEKTARDLPLFSPVHKSLFDHLRKRGDNVPDWNSTTSINSFKKGLIPAYWPFALQPGQSSPDFMRTLQYFVYNELNGQPFMRSEYSLLPYILFSPYSPIRLSTTGSTISPDQKGSKVDQFPYCEAFEDLIRETVRGNEVPHFPFGSHWTNGPICFGTSPVMAMFWVQNLHHSRLLQQKEHKSVRNMINWPDPLSSPYLDSARELYDISEASPETERDMYDFLSASIRNAGTLGSLFNDAEGFIQRQLKTLEGPEGKEALREILGSKTAKDILEMVKALPSETKPRDKKSEYQPKTTQETNKVVATSTTSERNVDEDGSVETTVTVWKRFADGRESTTSTTHFEDAGAWKESEEGGQEVKAEKKPEETKKGWFWN